MANYLHLLAYAQAKQKSLIEQGNKYYRYQYFFLENNVVLDLDYV